jgi:hypothetical protein
MPEKTKTTTPTLPPIVYAEASPRSIGGVSLFEASRVTSDNVANFFSESQLVAQAVQRLRAEGFQVLNIGDTTITIGAPPETYERVFRTKLQAEERPVIKEGARADTATFVECPETDMPGLISTEKKHSARCSGRRGSE